MREEGGCREVESRIGQEGSCEKIGEESIKMIDKTFGICACRLFGVLTVVC